MTTLISTYFTKEELDFIESALFIFKDEFVSNPTELEQLEKLYTKVKKLQGEVQ